MKKLIFLALAALIFCSCSSPFLINTKGYTVYHMTVEEASAQVASQLTGYKECDTWYSPSEIIARGTGDCKSYTTLMMYYLGPESSAAFVYYGDSSFVDHAVVFYHGRYIEPQYCKIYPDNYYDSNLSYGKTTIRVSYTLSYDTVMRYATDYGTRNLLPMVK